MEDPLTAAPDMSALLHFTAAFAARPASVALLALTAAVAWPAGRRLGRRAPGPMPAGVLLVLAIGVVAALTAAPNPPEAAVHTHFLRQLADRPDLAWAALTAWPMDAEQQANVALYVPVGAAAALLWRSAGRGLLCGVVLTLVIETGQYGIVGRDGSFTDLRNNALGALLGAVAAGALNALRRRRNRRRLDGNCGNQR